jgi:hypothetical protein
MIRVSVIPIVANTRGVDLWSVEYLCHVLPFNQRSPRWGGRLSQTRLR